MAGDTTPTRQATVAANLAAIKTQRGDENWNYIFTQLLTDISTSLAMLVDNDTTPTTTT